TPLALRTALEANAKTHELLGTYDSAVVSLSEALRLQEDTSSIEFAYQLNHLANNLFYQGRFDSVVTVTEQVLGLPADDLPAVTRREAIPPSILRPSRRTAATPHEP
ncbi:MAG: hypothetical protein IPK85_00535, partial [Gemmatimonadetes bacterium]|nr:hypothetical protein [Gemmatimonadota bacterium]